MEPILILFYIALFGALIFFGPLQEYWHKKKSEWDAEKRLRELKADEPLTPADPEKNRVDIVNRAQNISHSLFYLENIEYYLFPLIRPYSENIS